MQASCSEGLSCTRSASVSATGNKEDTHREASEVRVQCTGAGPLQHPEAGWQLAHCVLKGLLRTYRMFR